jgi:predicted DNA-binding protein (MmcQ/YjbR family)
MNIEEVYEYCLSLPSSEETFPFDATTLVVKVAGKMFAILPLDGTEKSISLKCDPERAIKLREEFSFILPGYHLNKKHWNTLRIEECESSELLKELILHSYQLIVNSLPKSIKVSLK